MENPLWHDSLTFERLLERRLNHPLTKGAYLSRDEVHGLVKQLELMRKQLPPA